MLFSKLSSMIKDIMLYLYSSQVFDSQLSNFIICSPNNSGTPCTVKQGVESLVLYPAPQNKQTNNHLFATRG